MFRVKLSVNTQLRSVGKLTVCSVVYFLPLVQFGHLTAHLVYVSNHVMFLWNWLKSLMKQGLDVGTNGYKSRVSFYV